ncbi:MAG TPA: GNAT family N-acetyltransferase, partial [Dehalococcoidia bacterium]|nr:GNAT family N-acetyltransferase [Dehalococcoidia bacterium]
MAAFDVRDLAPEDVEPLGDVIYEAFRDVATKHGFRPTFDSPATASLLLNTFRATELATIVTAAEGAEPVGSASMNVRSETAGIGPVAVSPRAQAGGVGRAMMEELLRRADAEGCTSVRLVQAGYNVTSFSLYSKLGFVVRDVVLSLEGRIEAPETDASAVREMRPEETATAAALDTRLTGFRREPDFALLRGIGPGWVWEQDGIVRGYLLSLGASGSVHLG